MGEKAQNRDKLSAAVVNKEIFLIAFNEPRPAVQMVMLERGTVFNGPLLLAITNHPHTVGVTVMSALCCHTQVIVLQVR